MNEWVKCSERMPDDGVAVLCYCVCNSKPSGIYTMRKPVIVAKNLKEDTRLIKHERVTHWMPLPEPPKE